MDRDRARIATGPSEGTNGSSLTRNVRPFPSSLGCEGLVLRPLLTSVRVRPKLPCVALAFSRGYLLPGKDGTDLPK